MNLCFQKLAGKQIRLATFQQYKQIFSEEHENLKNQCVEQWEGENVGVDSGAEAVQLRDKGKGIMSFIVNSMAMVVLCPIRRRILSRSINLNPLS
jgi:hypothetical protein